MVINGNCRHQTEPTYVNSASNRHLDDILSKKEGYSFLELELALKYLVEKTDYVNYIEFTAAYQITFIGRKFTQDGGYKTTSEKEINQKRNQNLKDFLLISGAWIASIAGSGLLFFEYVKLNHHYPYGLKFWKLFLGTSILFGLIVLCIWIYPKKRQQANS